MTPDMLPDMPEDPLPFTPPPVPEPEPREWSEAYLLELLRARYTVQSQGIGSRWVFATHVRGGSGWDQRTADAVVLDAWQGGRPLDPAHDLEGFEVKISRSDWLRELKDPAKCEAVRRYCTRWWLVVPDPRIVRAGELPAGWGLMAATANGMSLRTVVKAPKLIGDDVPRGFWVAFTRAAVKTEARRHQQ